MKKVILSIIGVIVFQCVQAQDLHFSQTSQTPMLINPAATGVFDGWERVTINHRNQWLGASTQFMTTNIAADINLGKGQLKMRDKAHVGIGLQFYNDIGGDSKFGSQTGSLTVSGILPMGGGHQLSAGIQGGYGQRKADLTAVTFSNQWNGSEYDPTLISGEANTATSFGYIDANAGLMYMFDGGKNSFARQSDFKFVFGVSGYHLNAPELKYSNGVTTEKLARKFIAHTEIIADISGSRMAIDASAVQIKQAGHYETILGLMLRYRFSDGTKITGNSTNAFFGFGMYARLKDAIIPSVMVDWKGFRFGMSYDVTVSTLRTAYSGGSLEFSLSFRNLDHSLFKMRKRRM